MNSRRKGQKGERKAEEFLLAKGYSIVARNFRNRSGEIDLIVQNDERIVFVEVKNWVSLGASDLEYSIDRRKQGRIREVSRYFLHTHPDFLDRQIRYDVILVSGREGRILHYENAFGVNGV